jgi:RNA polymerase sigma factor (sigma-70 family)
MVAATLADQSDRQLVEQFLTGQGEAVFEAIVRRHGAMVYRVCWRVLQHHQDVEDAFQATFLVLAQRLRTVRKHASLASWLHGVAHRVALKSKGATATCRRHEEQAAASQKMPPDDVSWVEVRAVLDAELAGLPEKWRLPLVLCYLEGRTQDEAAAELGWSKRTLRRRLEEGRTGLGRRLNRRGVVWPVALSAVLFSDAVASATPSPALLDSTIKAAGLIAAGQPAAVGLISAKAAALTEGVLKTMLLSKLKVAVAVLLAIGALGIGASGLSYRSVAGEPPSPVSKSAVSPQDEGNLKETVLALEKRIWEAHSKQDVNAFKNLLADDYVGTDRRGRSYTKKDVLGWVASFRVLDPVIKNTRVVLLNATGAIVTYEIRYRIASSGGRELETPLPVQAISGWALRDGKWWCVYSEASALGIDGIRSKAPGADERWQAADTWEIKPIHFKNNRALSDTKLEVVTDKGQSRVDKDRSDGLIEAVFERVASRRKGIPSAKYDAFVELATWKLMAVDAAKRTVSLRWSEVIALEGLAVAVDAQVVVDGQEKPLGDLKPGMWITPKLGPGRTRIAKIVATSKDVDLYAVWSVNAEQSIIKVRLGGFAVEFPVAKDARIIVNNEQVKLADLQPGMHVALDLGVTDNRIAVKTIRGRR